MRILRRQSLLAFGLSLFCTFTSASPLDFDTKSYLAVPGDFNGDGRMDALMQPLTGDGKGAVILQDSTGQLSVLAQDWDPGYLGLDWSTKASTLTTADFNGDGQDDVLVQPTKAGGTAAVLITDPTAQLLQISQLLPAGYLNLDWSSETHHAVAGDFDGDRRKELFMQATQPGGLGAIAHTDAMGNIVAITQTFADGYLGRNWNSKDETLYVGDFNGDGRQDLLVQSRGTIKGESAYALLLADGNGQFTHISETWNLNDLGADWNPATHKIIIEDANHDGIMDIVLQSTVKGGTNYVFEGNTQGLFTQPAAHWTGDKSASDVLNPATTSSTTATSISTKTSGTGISVIPSGGGITAKTITEPTGNPDQNPTTPSDTQGGQGSGQIMTVNAAGALQGSGGVSGGTATYSIPIAVPPGIAGIQPSISLNYSSRGGNGEMGMGWSVSAGSQIHRCPATYAMDQYSTGVTYTSTDRLCLDGQHLIYVSGGTGYGTDSAVYHTELDSMVQITESGAISSGTSSFTVQEKNGHTLRYGYGTNIGASANAVFTPSGAPAPLAWGLGMEVDTFNNSIIYYYSTFGAGEYLLTSIKYTGAGATAGNRQVTFNYSTRSDITTQYLAGGLTTQSQVLSSIVTTENGAQVRSYNTQYAGSGATNRTLLTGVQECGYTNGAQACLPETTFSWQNPAQHFNAPSPIDATDPCSATLSTLGAPYISTPGDVNGDGFKDLMYSTNCNTVIYLMGPGGVPAGSPIQVSGIFDDQIPMAVVDVNGDGAADLVGGKTNASNGIEYLSYSTFIPGTSSSPPSFSPAISTGIPYNDTVNGVTNPRIVAVEDVNGDGLADVVVVMPDPSTPGNHMLAVYLNTTTPCTAPCTPPPATFSGTPIEMFSVADDVADGYILIAQPQGDLDGNGLPDFAVTYYTAGMVPHNYWVFTQESSNGNLHFTSLSQSADGSTTAAFAATLMDINGDGLPDKVYDCGANNGTDLCYALNTGNIGPNLFGPQVDTGVDDWRHASAQEMGGSFTADIDNSGVQEILFPDTLLSDYCAHNQQVGSGNTVEYEDECEYGTSHTLPASADYSIYQYAEIKFLAQANGSYVPALISTNIQAQSHLASAIDIAGDGLTAVVSPFTKIYLAGFWQDQGSYTRPTGLQAVLNSSSTSSSNSMDAAPDMMLSASNGFGIAYQWDYFPLSSAQTFNSVALYSSVGNNGNGYQGGDYFNFTSSMYVVGDYTVSNGVGGNNIHDFHYGQAIYNNQGRGFQGFYSVVDDDMASGARTVQVYHQRFPLSGELQESWTTDQSNSVNLISPTVDSDAIDYDVYTWSCAQGSQPTMTVDQISCNHPLNTNTYVPILKESVETHYDVLSHDQLSKTDTQYCATPVVGSGSTLGTCTGFGYDAYANSLGSLSTTTDAASTHSASVTNTYDTSDVADWWINKLTSKVAVVDANYGTDAGAVSRETDYDYYQTQRVNHVYAHQDPNADPTGKYLVTTQYAYNYGNVTSVTVTGGSASAGTAVASRTTSTAYSTGADANYFVSTVTDPAGLTTSYTMDSRFGSPATVTAPDGAETTNTYDGFGRKISSQLGSLPVQTTSYITDVPGDGMCDGTSSTTHYYVLVNQTGYPSHYECYDVMNRVIRSVHENMSENSSLVAQSTYYDNLGRVTQFTEPHFSDASWLWNTNQYDTTILGRLISKTSAKGIVTSYVYNPNSGGTYQPIVTNITTSTPTDPLNSGYVREDQEIKDSTGKMLTVTNAVGTGQQAATSYAYDSDGNPISITAADGSVITAHFNGLGQKETVADPDQGTTTYVYDVAGDLMTQTDAKSQTLTMTYDGDGRMLTKTSSVSTEPAVTWVYDSATGCTNGAGKVCSVSVADGSYGETYAYTALGMIKTDIETIAGTAYETDTAYDSDGRIALVTYPDSIADQPPVANAGATQYVAPGATVTLDGSGTDNGPDTLDYQWAQTAGPTVALSSATAASPSFTAGTTLGTTYTFQLTADDGISAGTASVNVVVPNLPPAPAGITDNGDTNHDGSYTVSWQRVTDTGASIVYHLEEATGTQSAPTGTWTEVYAGSTPSEGISHAGNSYYFYWYRVRAEADVGSTSLGDGPYSGTDVINVVVTPGAPASISPANGTATGPASIAWTAGSGKITFYQLYESQSGASTLIYQGTAKTYTDPGEAPGIYHFKVRACNESTGTDLTECSGYTAGAEITWTSTGGGGTGCPTCQPQVVVGGPAQPIGGGAVPGGGTKAAPAKAATPVTQQKPATAKPPLALRHSGKDSEDRELAVTASQHPSIRHSGESRNPVLKQLASANPILPTLLPSGEGLGMRVRPRFAPPVYQAWADAHVQNASGTTPIARFSVQYVYSPNGYLYELTSGVNPNRVYWEADVFAYASGSADSNGDIIEHGMNAYGQVTDAIYGPNSIYTHYGYDGTTDYLDNINTSALQGSNTYQNLAYSWQAIGNLVSRSSNGTTSNPNVLSEGFNYDIHNRLINATVTNAAGTQPQVTYAYDSVGDITCRSDINGGTCAPGSTGYNYGGSAGPHAVTSITGTANGAVNPTYAYDADGNMTSRNGTTIAWNSDNLPTSILQDANNTSTFSYAPDKHRYMQVAMNNGVQETTIYAGGLEIFTSGGVTQYRHTLSAYGRPVFLEQLSNSSIGAPQEGQSYLLTDHLGSLDTVVDASGLTPPAPQSFDAFGHHRDPNTWIPVSGNGTTLTKHGFTHHEHLDNVGLIHMNGRVYDPTVGRFLSVDPVFQAPTNSQSVNPYSYVMDNPLSLVDPSGYAAAATPDQSAIASPNGAGTTAAAQLQQGDSLGKLADGTVVLIHADGSIDMAVTGIKLTAADGSTGSLTQNSSNSWSATISRGNGAITGSGTSVTTADGASGQQAAASTKESGQSQTQTPPPSATPPASSVASPASSAIHFDKDKFAQYLDDHHGKDSEGACAAYVRPALDAAGAVIRDKDGNPLPAAGDYGSALAKLGAVRVGGTGDLNGYKHKLGDVVVFDKNDAHPYGHIAGFDGKNWVSDWVQHSFIPYKDQSDVPTYTIYRFPDSSDQK